MSRKRAGPKEKGKKRRTKKRDDAETRFSFLSFVFFPFLSTCSLSLPSFQRAKRTSCGGREFSVLPLRSCSVSFRAILSLSLRAVHLNRKGEERGGGVALLPSVFFGSLATAAAAAAAAAADLLMMILSLFSRLSLFL